MSQQNPFAAPQSSVGRTAAGQQYPNIELVASGQKLVIYAILVNLLTVGRGAAAPALGSASPAFLFAVGAVALVLSLLGIYRLATGLEMGLGVRILCMLLMVVPLANLVVLLVLNSRATRALRDAGYTVGLLGASKAD